METRTVSGVWVPERSFKPPASTCPGFGRERFSSQAALDHRLQELDGTSDKSNLGANTLLAVSLAFARATACSENKFASVFFRNPGSEPKMPV